MSGPEKRQFWSRNGVIGKGSPPSADLCRFLLVNAVLGLWPTASSWAHAPNGSLDARHTAGTPGPATPATGFGGLTLCPSLGESFRKPVPRVAVSLCACGATPPFLRQGFLQPLRQPHGVPR